ncbi:MAG: amino acid-binding ACT domain protein [Thermoplasmata archaeon]
MLQIKEYFNKYSSQKKIAKFLLETGLSVRDGEIYCNGIQMSPLRISRVLNVDRRTVNSTIETIEDHEDLKKIFENLKATAFYGEVVKDIDAGMIEIVPTDPHGVGILAGVTSIIAEQSISVRQCITEDPEFAEEPKLLVITEDAIPMEILKEIREVDGVERVVLY